MEAVIKEFKSKPNPTIKDLGMLFRAFRYLPQLSALNSSPPCVSQDTEHASTSCATQQEKLTTDVVGKLEEAGSSDQQPPDDIQATVEAMPPNRGNLVNRLAKSPSSMHEKYSYRRVLLRQKRKKKFASTTTLLQLISRSTADSMDGRR